MFYEELQEIRIDKTIIQGTHHVASSQLDSLELFLQHYQLSHLSSLLDDMNEHHVLLSEIGSSSMLVSDYHRHLLVIENAFVSEWNRLKLAKGDEYLDQEKERLLQFYQQLHPLMAAIKQDILLRETTKDENELLQMTTLSSIVAVPSVLVVPTMIALRIGWEGYVSTYHDACIRGYRLTCQERADNLHHLFLMIYAVGAVGVGAILRLFSALKGERRLFEKLFPWKASFPDLPSSLEALVSSSQKFECAVMKNQKQHMLWKARHALINLPFAVAGLSCMVVATDTSFDVGDCFKKEGQERLDCWNGAMEDYPLPIASGLLLSYSAIWMLMLLYQLLKRLCQVAIQQDYPIVRQGRTFLSACYKYGYTNSRDCLFASSNRKRSGSDLIIEEFESDEKQSLLNKQSRGCLPRLGQWFRNEI